MISIRQRMIFWLHAVLLAILPINNFIGQILTNLWQLPAGILAWKEVLVLVICGLYLFEFSKVIQDKVKDKRASFKWKIFQPVLLFTTILMLAVISSVVGEVSLREFVLGFRVELLWVGFFALTSTWVATIDQNIVKLWKEKLINSALIGFALVSIIAIFSLLLGPQTFYSFFGYQDGWGSSQGLILESPLCHSVGGGLDKCRLTAGFATPNNLAAYLLLITPLLMIKLKKEIIGQSNLVRQFKISMFCFGLIWSLIMIYLTYSRSAWLALGISCILFFVFFVGQKFDILDRDYIRTIVKFVKVIVIILPIILLIIFLEIASQPQLLQSLPPQIGRIGSSVGHYKQTLVGVEIIAEQNVKLLVSGYGIAQSGPIAKPQYKDVASSKLAIDNIDIAEKYNVPIWEMAIPENWYLQLILNGGVVYTLLYIILISQSLSYLFGLLSGSRKFDFNTLLLSLAFYSLFVINLYLHVWENPVIGFYFSSLFIILNNFEYIEKQALTTVGK